MTDKQILEWLEEVAPIAIWRGSNKFGARIVEISPCDLDGNISPYYESLGTGDSLRAAVINANEPEEAA